MIINEKIIRKIVKNVVNKCLNEAMDDSFSYEELSSIRSFAQRMKYCKLHLGDTIGSGSSRAVFQIDDNKCLKLAKNQKGIAQNNAEFDSFAQSYGVMPKQYESADDNSWIIVEYVLPAKAKDFQVCLGMDFRKYCEFVKKCYNCYSSSRNSWANNSSISDEEFEEILENNEWLEGLYSYMADYQVPLGDMLRLVNYGMVQRGGTPEIVILDSGLTEQIYNEFYR